MSRIDDPAHPAPAAAPSTEAQREGDSPHDGSEPEPLGPATPDDQSAAGDSPEVHDGVIAADFPPGHPGHQAAEQAAAAEGGATRGNVESPLPGWLRRLFGRGSS